MLVAYNMPNGSNMSTVPELTSVRLLTSTRTGVVLIEPHSASVVTQSSWNPRSGIPSELIPSMSTPEDRSIPEAGSVSKPISRTTP